MNLSGPLDARLGGGAKSAAVLPRAVEKSSPSSRLNDGAQDFSQQERKPAPRLQVELVCQDETPRFDPFRDAPILVPSFVAQVLGQFMPERRQAEALAHTAYASAAPRKALLVDRRS
jgi:hypothetical protein